LDGEKYASSILLNHFLCEPLLLVCYSGKSLWTWHDKEEEALLLHNMYVGEYAKGQRSGKGTFYYASGAIFQVD
jgi:hypothetical protein